MPDIKSHETYTKRARALERAYLRDINRLSREARLRLLEAYSRGGLSPDFEGDIRLATERLGRAYAGLAEEYARGVEERAGWYFGKSIAAANEVAGAGVAANEFLAANRLRRLDTLGRNMAEGPLGWVDSMRATLLAEAGRLRLAGEPEATAEARLLGTQLVDGRAPAWRRGQNLVFTGASLLLWGSFNWALGSMGGELEQQTGLKYQKQAIAAIDERTTDCCLNVHGQIKPLDKPFKLVGTPRFADEVMQPPFHWYCRTSTALYLEEFEVVGISTGAMEQAARLELEARERTGYRVEIHPASATSTRSRMY